MKGEGQRASLKAILFADLAKYSLLVGERESETLRFVQSCFDLVGARCREYGGEVIKTTGDGLVAQFDSASAAVEFAVAMHAAVDALQGDQNEKAKFRIGVHLGEVQHIGADLYGHAVNVAARLESIAEPGGVCVSHAVYQQARHGTKFGFVAAGTPRLKNIAEPIAVYHVASEGALTEPHGALKALQVSVIDGLSVRPAGGEPIRLRSPHLRAVLGYLALSTSHRETFDRLAALIYPNRDTEAAHRTLMRLLRSADMALMPTMPGALRRAGSEVALSDRLVEIDLVRVHESATLGLVDALLLERHDWSEAILTDLDGVSPSFSTWLRVARHNWRTKITDALETCLVRFDAAENNLRQAAEALLLIEPSHERAAQALIRHFDANRNPAAARRVYRDLSRLLKRRYEITPSAETLALFESIANGRADRLPPIHRAAPVQLPRVGVAPFVAEKEAASEAHIVAGFRNELIANLSRFREWIVFELDAASTPDGPSGKLEYVLSANSHVSVGNRELTVMLTDAVTRQVVWCDASHMSIANWFEAQRTLVRRIAAQLEVYFSSDRLAKAISLGENDLSAYDDWLRGEHLLSLWTPAAEDGATKLFERAIARSPSFAPAYASLAGIHNVRHLIRPGLMPDVREDCRALDLARRSVELDPLDARNHLVVGWTSAMARQFEHSAFHYELAVSLNPNSPRALISCAQGLAFIGFPGRAARLLEDAFALSPVLLGYQWCYVVSTRWMIGDFAGALAAAELSGNTTIDTPGWRAAALARLGRLDEARQAFAEQVRLAGAAWAGHDRPSPRAILSWFLSAFPIAHEADHAALRQALLVAAEIEAYTL